MSPDRGWQERVKSLDGSDVVERVEVGDGRLSGTGGTETMDGGGDDRLKLTPEDEEKPVLIAKLPEEILMYIVKLVATPKGPRGAKIVRSTQANGQTHGVPTPSGAAQQGDKRAKVDKEDTPLDLNSIFSDQMRLDPSEHNLVANTLTATTSTMDRDGHQRLPAGKRDVEEFAVFVPSSRNARDVGIGMVLGGADYMSIERLSRTCWKLRQMTKSWRVWKVIVHETYFPPQIPKTVSIATLAEEKFESDWHKTFIRQPRVRLNGAYIAAYHYTRPGTHPENVWVRVDHVVEFYRTLRFLPDGRALSLLTTDTPNDTLRRMEPALRLKGFAIGQWTVHPDGLSDDALHDRPAGPKVVVDDLNNKSLAGYTFRLVLKLDARKGKWDKMEMLEYESINLNTGEVCPLPMNHKKPFYFSVVRSYGI